MKKNISTLSLILILFLVVSIGVVVNLLSRNYSYRSENVLLQIQKDSLNRIIILSNFYTKEAQRVWGKNAKACTPAMVVMVDSMTIKYGDSLISTPTVLSVMTIESGFDQYAISPAGAKGLMQLIYSTGKQYGLITDQDFFNPVLNTRAGIKELAAMISLFDGNKELGLLAYNMGPTTVRFIMKEGISMNYKYYNKIVTHNYLYAQLQEKM